MFRGYFQVSWGGGGDSLTMFEDALRMLGIGGGVTGPWAGP